MAYSRTNTFSNGNTPTAAQIDANFTGIRTYVASGVVVADVTTDISHDKIKPPEVVYQTGGASLTLLATGCVASVANPPVNFRRERVKDVLLTYNGFLHKGIHFTLAADKISHTFGREVPKTGISVYLEKDAGVRVTYNIMVNAYMTLAAGGDDPDDDNYLFIGMYPHDLGEHDTPIYPQPNRHARAVFPNTTTTLGSPTAGDGPAGLRCITIHKCFDKTLSGSSAVTSGWYNIALFAGMESNFALVGANTCVVEAHYGKVPTISAGTAV
mgnify:FL=1